MALSSREYQGYEKVVTLYFDFEQIVHKKCFSPILQHLNHEKGKLSLTVSNPPYHNLSTINFDN